MNKNSLGREKFIKKVWEWKNQYGDIIINQLKKLGCSCDWSRNAFTMDDNLSKSVIKVFVELHKKKLIYKAEKLVIAINTNMRSGTLDTLANNLTYEILNTTN